MISALAGQHEADLREIGTGMIGDTRPVSREQIHGAKQARQIGRRREIAERDHVGRIGNGESVTHRATLTTLHDRKKRSPGIGDIRRRKAADRDQSPIPHLSNMSHDSPEIGTKKAVQPANAGQTA